ADGSFAFMTTFALNGSADGPHQLSFVATDQAGNTTAAAPTAVSFVLETQGPTLTVQAPPAVVTTNVTINGQAADPLSSVMTVMAQVDGAVPFPLTFDAVGHFSYTTAFRLDGSQDGLHTVQFMAINDAVKLTTRSVSFTLNTSSPTPTPTPTPTP